MNLLLMANQGLPRNGLVALYDPYRDTYGRNILPVGSENFAEVFNGWSRGTGETITITPNQSDPFGGNNAYRIQGNGVGTSPVKYHFFITLPTCTSICGMWIKVLSGNCQLGNGGAENIKTATNSWSFISSQRTNSTNMQIRLLVTNVTDVLDILVYQPQTNIGTLYPYSPPAGLPQSLTDYTGHANNAQLGSTAGADTNDPKFNGVALVGDGVEDYAVVPLASAAYRISVVDSGSGYVVVDEVPAYLNLFKTGAATYLNGKIGPTAYYNRVPSASEIAQAKRYFKRLMAGRGVTVS